MSESSQAIESAALSPPPEERARLAKRLLASIEADPEVGAMWAAEVRRRVEAWEAGEADEVPWDEARRQIEARVGVLGRPQAGSSLAHLIATARADAFPPDLSERHDHYLVGGVEGERPE
jgi:putative addiction module component (TIGR02574 family)